MKSENTTKKHSTKTSKPAGKAHCFGKCTTCGGSCVLDAPHSGSHYCPEHLPKKMTS
ncbi:MAG: hypothetical protein JXR79_09925 [Nitrospirae bacterium]|nr:hypothetical protein [Nitrospirota bacterium]